MKTLEELKTELIIINSQIERKTPKDAYLDAVNRSFPLGVGFGGSGKGSLNRRKERHLDKLIDASLELQKLYSKQSELEKQINDIESGEVERRAERQKTKAERLARYWKDLKPGDPLNIGNPNGNPIILRKSAKSVTTTSGTNWKAIEIIGKDAALLL